jgi:UDP-glucose 4-epimerase
MKTHAIVTGGAGFIGQALVKRLQSMDVYVTVIDDWSTHASPYQEILGDKLIIGRVQDTVMPADAQTIFHLAGKVGPVGVLRWKGEIAKDTIESAYIVGQWAREMESQLIDVSTSEVYGNDLDYNGEDDPKVFPYPASARVEYAVSKLAAETMLLNTRGLDVTIIRPFNIAGPGQRADGGFVIPRFVNQALDDDYITVYHPGSQVRSFTHIDDFIDGVIAVSNKGRRGHTYNLGNPYNKVTMFSLARQVRTLVGKGKVAIVYPSDLHGHEFTEAKDKIPESNKAMTELGWAPSKHVFDIVGDTIEYEMKRRQS